MFRLSHTMENLRNKRKTSLKQKRKNKYRTIISIVETLIINVIFYFIFYVHPINQEIYLSLNPHPILFLVMFMGLRYGIGLSLISAVISCVFYISVFVSVNGTMLHFFEYFDNYKYPLLYLWTGFIFGAFRDNHFIKMEKLDSRIKALESENKFLRKDYKLLEDIQKELKQQIIGSDQSIISLYDIATSLASFNSEDIYTETVGILKKYLKVTSVALFDFDEANRYLRLKIFYGDSSNKRNSIDVNECFWFDKIEKERKVMKILNKVDENSPLMVAPLIKNDKILAIISIYKMEFDMVSEYAFNLFQLIIDWINKALENATYVETLKNERNVDDTVLVNASYLRKRLEIERRRKKEFKMDYCFLSYRLEGFSIKEIDAIVRKTLRPFDLAYYNVKSRTISFLMPATNSNNTLILEEKLKRSFNDKLVDIELSPLED